jgi:hypothetical protein
VLVITLSGLLPACFRDLRQDRGTAVIPVKIPGNISFGIVMAITNQFHDLENYSAIQQSQQWVKTFSAGCYK